MTITASDLPGYNVEPLNESEDVVFVLDDRFRLLAHNQAWVKFAINNDGEKILTDFPVGADVIGAYDDGYQERFFDLYCRIVEEDERYDYDYECSSPDTFRLFRQSIYPVSGRLLITNHLRQSEAMTREAHAFSAAYITPHNMVVQCGHCRKVRHQTVEGRWDWVPSLVDKPHKPTSHTLCPNCFEFYYPA